MSYGLDYNVNNKVSDPVLLFFDSFTPVFLYWPFQGGTSVVVPYSYLFLLSVFILWFSYYVSDIFCKF